MCNLNNKKNGKCKKKYVELFFTFCFFQVFSRKTENFSFVDFSFCRQNHHISLISRSRAKFFCCYTRAERKRGRERGREMIFRFFSISHGMFFFHADSSQTEKFFCCVSSLFSFIIAPRFHC